MNCSRSNTHAIFLALYFSLVVQFSRIICTAVFAVLGYYTTKKTSCQVLFQTFFKFFSLFSSYWRHPHFLGVRLYIVSPAGLFVKHFFFVFAFLRKFRQIYPFMYDITYDFSIQIVYKPIKKERTDRFIGRLVFPLSGVKRPVCPQARGKA